MANLLAIDAGTTGITCLVIGEDGAVRGSGSREFPQSFPRPGWVEHDPADWWDATLATATEALAGAGIAAADLTGIGITNQRETTVLWDRRTLAPVHPAIVWQDRRTVATCEALRDEGWEDHVAKATGLVVDPYFSGTKLAWLLDEVDDARGRAEAGDLAFGTVDAYLIARLTGGREHVTDHTNASRTMLFDIHHLGWDTEMLERLRITPEVLPEVRPSSGDFGRTDPGAFLGARVPIAGVAGDQQAALVGQACFEPGEAKNTYGTGSFVLLNTGGEAPRVEGLLTTIAYSDAGAVRYALEGSIFVTGAAIQWLRDGLGIIGAARGAIVGITRGTTRAHLARAAVEAIAFQTKDVVDLMVEASGVELAALKVDGGAAAMDLLCAFQADLLEVPVLRPRVTETTALGAASLAGLATGVWASKEDAAAAWRLDREFAPSGEDLHPRHADWRRAVERSLGWDRD